MAASSGYQVGVCIPVAADPRGLETTLSAIAALGDEASGVSVIVAIDGGSSECETVARAAGATCVVLPDRRGSYAARNAAVAALPLGVNRVLFTDAGCRPLPGWIRGHLRALENSARSGGGVEITTGSSPTAAEWVDRLRNLRQQAYVETEGWAATCNLGVRREVLDALSFDEVLQSGGDRDFGIRAGVAGFGIVYSADAAVQHPARRSVRSVVMKARRVGRGVAALPPDSQPSRLPNRRTGRRLARLARAEGVSRGWWWEIQVTAIDRWRAEVLHRAASVGRPPVDVHVVVLLGSRWAALEDFSTRMREVVVRWQADPRVGALTLVDYPTMRRRSLIQRRLVRRDPSWLPGAELLAAQLPVDGTLRTTDRLAWWRTCRAIRHNMPAARRHVVVAATPMWGPALNRLGRADTVTAFDAVDIANLRARFASSAERLESGYQAAAQADVVTAVAESLAQEMRRAGARIVQVVENGVDVELLRTPAPPPAAVSLPDVPFAVYLGTVGGRIDLDLLEAASDLVPSVPFVVAGPTADGLSKERLESSRLRWIGPVTPGEVPGLLQAAAVGLLPYKQTDLFEALDSMKLLQYLGAGLPVVSTPLTASPDGVRLAATAPDFAAAVREAVTEDLSRSAPPAALAQRSWESVASRLLDCYLSAGR